MEHPILETMYTKTFSLDPARDNFDKILELEESLPEKYDPLIAEMKGESFWMNRDDIFREAFWESSEKNMNYINTNHSWARKSDSLGRVDAYAYYLTNPGYKNRLYAHWVHMERYLKLIHNYRRSAINLLADLKVYRDQLRAPELRSFYEDLNLVKLPKVGCNGNAMDQTVSSGEYTFLTNLSSDTLRFDNYDLEDFMLRKYVLAPNESMYTRTRWDAAEALQSRMLEIKVDGDCMERYVEVSGGYIVVE
jgi:hypothetical protein